MRKDNRFVCHAADIMAVWFSMRRVVTTLLFSMRRVVTTLLFSMRMARLSRLARGRAPKGRRGLTPTGTTPDVSTDNINESEKERKVTLAHGNPLRPCGPPPLQGGGVLPPDGQTLCCGGFQTRQATGQILRILALLRMLVTYLAIVRQECRTSYKRKPLRQLLNSRVWKLSHNPPRFLRERRWNVS